MHQTIVGRIIYTSNKPERQGAERGRERFTLIRHQDGRRSLQAHSEIDDPPNVLRLVTSSFDKDFRPLDAHVRLSVGDRFFGSTWYRFSSTRAECQGFTTHEGRISQLFEVDRPIVGFGSHPIQNDAWVCAAYDLSKGPGRQPLNLMLSSLDHRGATGPTLISAVVDVVHVGRETITVKAGTFDALHFTFGSEGDWADDDPLKHPVYHLWCTADGDYVVLRAHVEGYMQTAYELVSLERS